MLSLLICVTAIVGGAWAMRDVRGGCSVDWRLGAWEYSVNGSTGKVRAGRDCGLPRTDGTRPASQPTIRIDWWYGDWISVRAGHQDFLAAGVVYRQWYSVAEISATILIGVGTIGLLLALAIIGVRRVRRRRPPGSCGKCAYDLTGNTSGVCPECGSSVAGGKAVKT